MVILSNCLLLTKYLCSAKMADQISPIMKTKHVKLHVIVVTREKKKVNKIPAKLELSKEYCEIN